LSVENNLAELLKKLHDGKQFCMTHHFIPMNRDKRAFIHELTDFYWMESESYGDKANRSVSAKAIKGKSIAPQVKLSTILREILKTPNVSLNNFRQIPVKAPTKLSMAQIKESENDGSGWITVVSQVNSNKEDIDYWDDDKTNVNGQISENKTFDVEI